MCEECRRPKLSRLLYDGLGVQDCATCMEVVTRHRCAELPNYYDLAVGEVWECRDCGSKWTVREIEEWCPDCCGDCGHKVTRRDWAYEEGPRMDTAPRYEPKVFTPLRNVFKGDRIPGKPFPGLPY